jgi:hypothetical protein
MATTGENYGVVGASSRRPARRLFHIQTAAQVSATRKPGVLGEGSGFGYGVVGRAGVFGAGVKGEGNLTSFGGWFTSTDFVALYITSNREDNTDALVLDGAKDGGNDFSVTNDGDVKQALASNGLSPVPMPIAATFRDSHALFNNVGGTIVVTGTATGKCTINFGFNVYDRFFVATSQSSADRFVSCYTNISKPNELYCSNWDAAGANQNGAIMLLVY